jgi:hypothetical protein
VLQGEGGMRQHAIGQHIGCHATAAVGRCYDHNLHVTGSSTCTTTGGAK